MLKGDWPLYGSTQVGNKKPRPGTDLKFWVGKKSKYLFVDFPNKAINQVYRNIANLSRKYPEDVEKQLEEARKLSDKLTEEVQERVGPWLSFNIMDMTDRMGYPYFSIVRDVD